MTRDEADAITERVRAGGPDAVHLDDMLAALRFFDADAKRLKATLASLESERNARVVSDRFAATVIQHTMRSVDAHWRVGVPVNLMTIDYPAIIAAARKQAGA